MMCSTDDVPHIRQKQCPFCDAGKPSQGCTTCEGSGVISGARADEARHYTDVAEATIAYDEDPDGPIH